MIAALLAAALNVAASANLPARTAHANTVTSTRDPRVRIVLPHNVQYAGTDAWMLYGIANCQLFAFVQADANKRVQTLYWIQVEGYVPSMPKLQHTYNSPRHATIGGMDFFVDTWTEKYSRNGPAKPNLSELTSALRAMGYTLPANADKRSDDEHIYALLRTGGYTLPMRMASARLVHLLDNKRKEMMIIYSEDATHQQPADSALIHRALAGLHLYENP